MATTRRKRKQQGGFADLIRAIANPKSIEDAAHKMFVPAFEAVKRLQERLKAKKGGRRRRRKVVLH